MVGKQCIALVIIARNESENIGTLIAQLGEQTLLTSGRAAVLQLLVNGSSDDTAFVAGDACVQLAAATGITWNIAETPVAGKARSWNIAVHELLEETAEFAIFMDADIEFAHTNVLQALLDQLAQSPSAVVVSGHPIKDVAKKKRKSLVDRFSLRVSAQTPAPHSINGSLYVARLRDLREIWLPVPTPGEDGMLSAMIHTQGFSSPPKFERVEQSPEPTHYFKAHSIPGFFRHEQRMTVGTTINGWLFECFWSGQHAFPVGPKVAAWNANDPDWVDRLIAARVKGRSWVIPPRLLTWRLHNLRGQRPLKIISRAPFSLAATILNIWPCIMANGTLKKKGASSYW